MSEIDDVARELVLLFRGLKGLHRQVLAEVGVRVELPATAVLTTLAERGSQRLSTVAEVLDLDLSSVSRQVSALEREGWVARERDPADSRAVLLDLTDAGRAVLDRVREARVAHLAARLPGWSTDELRAFSGSLARFRTDLTRHVPTDDRTPALAGQETS